jgi:hypothetical protein
VVDYFTLSGDEAGWLRNKSGATVQADLTLGGLEALLDAPTDTGDVDQLGKGDLSRRPAQVEGEFTGSPVASDQQVTMDTGAGVDPRPVVDARALRSPLQACAQLRVLAAGFVAGHPRRGHSGVQRGDDHLPGQVGLCGVKIEIFSGSACTP